MSSLQRLLQFTPQTLRDALLGSELCEIAISLGTQLTQLALRLLAGGDAQARLGIAHLPKGGERRPRGLRVQPCTIRKRELRTRRAERFGRLLVGFGDRPEACAHLGAPKAANLVSVRKRRRPRPLDVDQLRRECVTLGFVTACARRHGARLHGHRFEFGAKSLDAACMRGERAACCLELLVTRLQLRSCLVTLAQRALKPLGHL